MGEDVIAALSDGCGRGFTVVCTIPDSSLLGALAAIVGPTGFVIAARPVPPAAPTWAAVRCEPARSLPLRSHVVDAAVLNGATDLSGLAEETRRVLVPSGDVRVLLSSDGDVESAFVEAGIRPLRIDSAGVLIAKGP